MADKAEKTEETQSQASTEKEAAGTEKEATEKKEAQGEDYEAKYKTLQGEHQKAIEERDNAQSTLDTVYPAIDFSKLQGGQAEGEEGEKPPLTQEDLDKHKQEITNSLLTIDFRQKHPELRDYEGSLIGPAIARIRMANPRMPLDKVLEKAAEESTSFLESEREKGRTEADKKKADAAAAGGLGAAGSKSTKKPEDEGETAKQVIARRQKESAKARGLI